MDSLYIPFFGVKMELYTLAKKRNDMAIFRKIFSLNLTYLNMTQGERPKMANYIKFGNEE